MSDMQRKMIEMVLVVLANLLVIGVLEHGQAML